MIQVSHNDNEERIFVHDTVIYEFDPTTNLELLAPNITERNPAYNSLLTMKKNAVLAEER
jgi:hypothetical protein